MFSTFTGNSRRPRNVNLSGQAGNPFNNTSWTPSTASSATKTVSNAQADREKRQADRHRLKAANQIQRAWRGHRSRQHTYDSQRRSFDNLYQTNPIDAAPERVTLAYSLLRSFFTARRVEDRQRLLQFLGDCRQVGLADSPPFHATPRQAARFSRILLDALNSALADKFVQQFPATPCWRPYTSAFVTNELGSDPQQDTLNLVDLARQFLATSHSLTSSSAGDYFGALATLCQSSTIDSNSSRILVDSFSQPLILGLEHGSFILLSRANSSEGQG